MKYFGAACSSSCENSVLDKLILPALVVRLTRSNKLRDSKPNSHEVDSILRFLGRLPISELNEKANPALRFNLSCLNLHDDNNIPQALLIALALSAFDSFCGEWPPEFSISLRNTEPLKVLLPCLRLRVRAPSDAVLNTTSIRHWHATNPDTHFKPMKFVVPVHNLAYNSKVISPQFETNEDAIAELDEQICQAQRLIELTDLQLAKDVEKHVAWYVAILGGAAGSHASFTLSDFPETIFLSRSMAEPSDVASSIIAEAIVHEHAHLILHSINRLSPIVDMDPYPKMFYAPWRKDPRPLYALLHGIYSFYHMMEFNRKLLRICDQLGWQYASLGERTRRRYNKLRCQLTLALPQVPTTCLSAVGQELFGAIELKPRGSRIFEDELAKAEVAAHFREWGERNEHHMDNAIYRSLISKLSVAHDA
jgi:hypothetical protein